MSIYDEYTHLRCECGGHIGMYDRENFTCEQCGKIKNIQGEYDRLMINYETGWIFPFVKKNK